MISSFWEALRGTSTDIVIADALAMRKLRPRAAVLAPAVVLDPELTETFRSWLEMAKRLEFPSSEGVILYTRIDGDPVRVSVERVPDAALGASTAFGAMHELLAAETRRADELRIAIEKIAEAWPTCDECEKQPATFATTGEVPRSHYCAACVEEAREARRKSVSKGGAPRPPIEPWEPHWAIKRAAEVIAEIDATPAEPRT